MKLFNFSLKKLLYNKRFTVPFSVLMAFALWIVITVNQKPTMERTISDIAVNVNMENTFASENDMSIIGDISHQRFTVAVRGPSYVVSSLTSSDFSLYASAAAVDAPGEYSLEVAATNATASAEYEILSISPSKITINFDYIETKDFTLTAKAEGAAASEGLIAETGVVSGIESDTVTVKGPRTVVNKIASVTAVANVNKTLSVSETFDAKIVLFDENGKEIEDENLTLSISQAKVTVPISKKKTVPVKTDFSSLPSGFDKSSLSVRVDHPTVTIIGTPETVDKTDSVSLSPIDITSVSLSSKSFKATPKLPDGVRMLDSIESFTVTVKLDGYAEKSFTVSKIRSVGLGGGLSADGIKSIVNVKLCGPKSVIDKIKAEQLYAQIDLTDKKAGEHTVNAEIYCSDVKTVWQVGEYKTTVTIK